MQYSMVHSGSTFKLEVEKVAYFGCIDGRDNTWRELRFFSDKEEVPGSSPGRPTTMSTFVPQTGSVAILSLISAQSSTR